MKKLLILSVIFIGCMNKGNQKVSRDTMIAMPDFYKPITGCDSIQLVLGGRGKYNELKQDFDVTWDSLYANFCYPNKWEFEKWKKDTVYIYDTVYIGYHSGKSSNKKSKYFNQPQQLIDDENFEWSPQDSASFIRIIHTGKNY